MKEWPKDLKDAVWDARFKKDEEVEESVSYYDELGLEFWRRADNASPQLIFMPWIHEYDLYGDEEE